MHVDFLQHKNVADKMLSDHDALMSGICSNRRWIYELCQLGMPRFGELAVREQGRGMLLPTAIFARWSR
jgi:hypothetical protein